jgi:exodeoxyribonuclease VII large subunit
MRARLDRSLERLLQSSVASLNALDARLHSLSPLAVLDRGYALVLSAEGALVRSAAQIAAGDRLTTRLADGAFVSRVEATAAAASQTAPNSATPAPSSGKRGHKSKS